MRKFTLLVFLTATLLFGSQQTYAQFVVAEDNAGNYSTWETNNNGGFGFSVWDMWKTNNAGWFLGSSSSQNFGNIDTDSKAFGMYGNTSSTDYAYSQRILNTVWGDGASFTIDLAIAYRNGNKGIDLFNSSWEKLWNFNVGSDNYSIDGTAVSNTNWDYNQSSIFSLTVKQVGANLQITLKRGTDSYYYNQTINDKTLYAFKLYNGNTQTGDLNNLYFNNLKVEYTDWSKVPADKKVKVTANGTANANKSVSDLEIVSGATLTVDAGKQLTVTGTATNNGTIKLLSNSTDGTATLKGDVTGNAEVNQSVTGLRTYYLGSPVSSVTALSGITGVSTFNVSADTWATLKTSSTNPALANSDIPTDGTGFLGQVSGTETTNISLTGTLNTGNKAVTLVTDATKKFNFLGNPYPSYLDAKKVVDNNTTVQKSIWYRGQGTDKSYNFSTYNVPTDLSIPSASVDPTAANNGFIPPMQGFWVKATSAGTFTFTDAMRTHNTTTSAIPLKAPQQVVNQILRLQVSNGTASDEAVVLFNENAQSGYDAYDASKMMNTGTGALNIYTVLGTENLVLNSQPEISYGVEIPVGMNLPAGTYTVSANEFSNFAEGTNIRLLDKTTGAVTNLTTNGSYEFTLTETLNSNTRFALVFPQNTPTGVDKAGTSDVTVFTRSNRIVVAAGEAAQGSMIYVFNGMGQRVAAQAVSGTINEVSRTFPAGVYVVKVNNQSSKIIIR